MATENKNLSSYNKSILPKVGGITFGIVVSEWNKHITEGLYEGAYQTLLDCGATSDHIIRYDVPGSFELIFACKQMQKKTDVVIAIGSVIKGETQHFDFVCEGVTQGIKDLNLNSSGVPVIFCVLTDNTEQQALDRSGGKHGNKGVEAAVAAIQMTSFLE